MSEVCPVPEAYTPVVKFSVHGACRDWRKQGANVYTHDVHVTTSMPAV